MRKTPASERLPKTFLFEHLYDSFFSYNFFPLFGLLLSLQKHPFLKESNCATMAEVEGWLAQYVKDIQAQIKAAAAANAGVEDHE